MELVVRSAGTDDFAAVGELLVRVFIGGGFTAPELASDLRAVAARAAAMDLVVVGDASAVCGAVYWLVAGNAYADLARAGEGEIQLLAVDPAARGRGVGEALVRECLVRARRAGVTRVVLSTQPTMTPAHRLYERCGFGRVPARDWQRRGVARLAYTLDLEGGRR